MSCATNSRLEHREARRLDVAPHVAFRTRILVSLTLLAAFVRAAHAQAQGSFGLGVGTVRYTGGTSVSTASFSPAWTFDSPNTTLSFAGTLASVPLGVWSSQGRADLWLSTPPAFGGLRFGLQGTAAGTARTDGDWTAATHGVAELLWAGQTWGVGIGAGPSAGWIANTSSVTALHTRARAWWQAGTLMSYSVSLEPTRFLGAWFTDATASVTANRRAVAPSLWATARISSAYGSKAAGGVLVRVFPVTRLAFELGAGSYLADPYQGLPRGGYLTAGVRLFTARRSVPPVASPALAPLVPARRGDSVVVRFHMEGASSVAIAGNWDGWQVRALSPLGGDVWEGVLALRSGTYHFNLLVDGKEWVVPGSVAIVTDDGGGMDGVLLVP